MLKKKFFVILLTLTLITLPTPKALAASFFAPQPEQEMIIEARSLDPRAMVLRGYLAQYNSPLQDNAQDFIDAADTFGVDWKLVPAIAGVESTFGKAIPGGFNGWGWGVYGTQAIYFNSWRDGIYEVTQGLKENYIDDGLTTPFTMNRRYAASPHWGWKVSYFIKDIEEYSKKYPVPSGELAEYQNSEGKTAASSAELTLNPFNLAFLP